MTRQELINIIVEGFDNPRALKALAALKDNIWSETPVNPNHANEYILIAGKRTVIRDIEIILQNKESLK